MSGSRPARIAIFFGLLALLAIPVAGALSVFLTQVNLLPAVIVAVPVAFFFGVCGWSAARRARYRVERSVHRAGERTLRRARIVVWGGLYLAVVGGLALAFYGALRVAGG
jgi:hypothetical protein